MNSSYAYPAILIALALTACACPPSRTDRHTTVVLLIDGNFVVLASDSRQTMENDNQVTTQEVCKLRRLKGVAYASIGLVNYESNSILFRANYDVNAIAERALAGAGSLASRVDAIDRELEPAFQRAMDNMEFNRPLGRSILEPRRPIAELIQMLFVARTDDGVAVSVRQYAPEPLWLGTSLSRVRTTEFDCITPNCSRLPQPLALGEASIAEKTLKTLIASGEKIPLPLLAKAAIEAQSEVTPAKVGPPVDIITADAVQGPTWFARKVGCPADQR